MSVVVLKNARSIASLIRGGSIQATLRNRWAWSRQRSPSLSVSSIIPTSARGYVVTTVSGPSEGRYASAGAPFVPVVDRIFTAKWVYCTSKNFGRVGDKLDLGDSVLPGDLRRCGCSRPHAGVLLFVTTSAISHADNHHGHRIRRGVLPACRHSHLRPAATVLRVAVRPRRSSCPCMCGETR